MTSTGASPTVLPLARLRPSDNPRRYFDQQKHNDLVASFRLRGVLQPLLVRPAPDGEDMFAIVAGGRRYRAALEAFGPEGEVPVTIRAMTDQEALEAAIDENDNREDASETEQADAAVRVLAACNNERAEAARRLGWSPAKLDRRLALANLSDTVKCALDERRIKVGHAELLAVVPPDKQDAALKTIEAASLDVGRTRELLMRVTQALASASFDKTECTTCPFNSGMQRALFETHVDDGHCTNPGCFQLKTEAASGEKTPADAPGEDRPSTPDRPSDPRPDQTAVPAKPALKSTVSAKTIASRVAEQRAAAWRAALIQAGEGDPEFLRTFEAMLRDVWRVNAAFLSRFNKDELKFIAQECGLVKHMGAKAFAKLLDSTVPGIVSGMIHAKGFDWAGRLPGAMTVDGKFSAASAAAPQSEKA